MPRPSQDGTAAGQETVQGIQDQRIFIVVVVVVVPALEESAGRKRNGVTWEILLNTLAL